MGKIIYLAVLVVCIGFAQVTPSVAASIDFSTTGPTSVTSGNNYSWDIIVSGLAPGGIVAAYDLDVLYNPLLLTVNSVAFGTSLGVDWQVWQDYNLPGGTMWRDGVLVDPVPAGVIDVAAMSWLSDQELQAIQGDAGQVVLVTLNFTALVSGSTSLGFDWYPGQDVKGNDNEIIAGYNVPEPGTLLLLVAGLAAWLPFRRRLNLGARFFGK